MTVTTGNRLSRRSTVRTVRTVREHAPATACVADGTRQATVRRPSDHDRRQAEKQRRFAPVRSGRFGRSAIRPNRETAPTRPKRPFLTTAASHPANAAGPTDASFDGYRDGNGSRPGLFRSLSRTQDERV
jgi:hypothetical protein